MTGHIRRRGIGTWEIKFDIGTDPATGKRLTRYHSFKGTKREAEVELIRLKAAADKGDYIDPVKVTLGEFLDRWETWVATQVSAKTLEGYKDKLTHHVRPHLGALRLQKVKTVHFADLYGRLMRPKAEGGAGLAPLSVGHVHRIAHRVFVQAVKWGLVSVNPVEAAEPPRVVAKEIEILTPERVKGVIEAFKSDRLYALVVTDLATGMRRGELVALKWKSVDLDRGRIRVEGAIEQTKGPKTGTEKPKSRLAFKAPKTKAGRREVSIPPSIVRELRTHWLRQQEERLALGMGKATDDTLVFGLVDGSIYPPNNLSSDWRRKVGLFKLPKVTFNALRHTHVSQLIALGVDVVTVSRRIGHASPTVTLNVYAHLFGDTDERASNAVELALASMLTE